jgi:hypothetical protein
MTDDRYSPKGENPYRTGEREIPQEERETVEAILRNEGAVRSIEQGVEDIKAGRGRFIDGNKSLGDSIKQ